MEQPKVIIEVTPEGWTTKLILNEKEYIERHKSTSYGSKCIEGDFEAVEEIPDEIYHVLSGIDQYHIMRGLEVISDLME